MKKILISSLVVLICSFLFYSSKAAQVENPANHKDSSLYSRLGSKEGISKLILESIANMVSDRRINMRFAKSDAHKMQNNWDSIICNKSGGNCTLPVFPQKFKASDAEWNAALEDIVKALDKFKVGAQEKAELNDIIKGLRKDYFNE